MIETRRVVDIGDRPSTVLSTDDFAVMINDDKGMIPELSVRTSSRWVNAHWNPWFRRTTPEAWDPAVHADRWQIPLLLDLAGNFPCAPNFGPPHTARGRALPAHGVTASETWVAAEPVREDRTAFVKSTLETPLHPLVYRKWDLVTSGQPIHYVRLDVHNPSGHAEPYNIGWHNTVGPPFLESGCIIDNSATAFATPLAGGEFDDTGRLAFAAEFDSLERAPLRSGGTANLREVPGPIGYADFVAGAVPTTIDIAWVTLVNPRLKLVYLCFYPTPESGGIDLNFHDLWLNYGGRHFMPWAAADDMRDRSFCLGLENATGCFADGLAASLERSKVLGRETHLVSEPGSTASLLYGTAFAGYPDDVLDGGVAAVERGRKGIAIIGKSGKSTVLDADSSFTVLKQLQ